MLIKAKLISILGGRAEFEHKDEDHQALFMPSAHLSVLLLIHIELKFQWMSWHALNGLVLGLPGFFFLGLLLILLCLNSLGLSHLGSLSYQ